MGEFHLDSEDVRYILQNAGKIKKDGRCINCNGTGWMNWNDEGEDLKPGHKSYDKDGFDRDEGECEKCDGVGFTW